MIPGDSTASRLFKHFRKGKRLDRKKKGFEMICSGDYVLLCLESEVVGVGKLFGVSGPVRRLHGYNLDRFEEEGQDLVVICSVQIFVEFESLSYPFRYHCLDGTPSVLGDMNKAGGLFMGLVAWDYKCLVQSPMGIELADSPRVVSRDILKKFDTRIKVKRVRFGPVTNQTSQEQTSTGQCGGRRTNLSRLVSKTGSYKELPLAAEHSDRSEDANVPMEALSEAASALRRQSGAERFTRQPGLNNVRTKLLSNRYKASAVSGQKYSKALEGSSSDDINRLCSLSSQHENSDAEFSTEHQAAGSDTDTESSKSNASSQCPSSVASEGTLHVSESEVIAGGSENGMPGGETSVVKMGSSFKGSNLTEEFPTLKRRYTFHAREKAKKPRDSALKTQRREESVRIDNPFVNKRECCSILRCFHLVDTTVAFRAYKRYMAMRASSRSEYRQALEALYCPDKLQFEFNGRAVCSRFLQAGFKFSNDLQSAVKKTALAGSMSIGNPERAWSTGVPGIPKEIRRDTARDVIVRYLRELAQECGEMMPHQSHINLPDKQRSIVYEQFVKFQKEQTPPRRIPSLSYFFSVWQEYCRNIRTRVHSGFTICSICEDLRSRFIVQRGNEAALSVLRDEKRLHINLMREERISYMSRAERAIRDPHKYCSLILDGADQKNYGLPHFSESTKSDTGHKIKVKCVGVLEHLKEKRLSLFTVTDEHESGANHIIEALHRTLNARKRRFGKLPEILYVQADNCTRENKNRFFMSYLELLVAKAVFVEVQVSFLPIGHTHADIDQAFSAVSKRLKVRDTATMNDLLHELNLCYSPRASASEMTRIANFSGLCKEMGCCNLIKWFSRFRYFRFTRFQTEITHDNSFKTECHVKTQIFDEWKPLPAQRGTRGFLKFVPDLSLMPPTETVPPENVADVNKCLRAVEQRVRNHEKMRELRDLRNRVYEKRIDLLHWNVSASAEMNGDYFNCNQGDEKWVENDRNGTEYEYAAGTFVAVKTKPNEESKFWIAQVLSVHRQNADGRPGTLEIIWYSPRSGYDDEFTAKYDIAKIYDRNAKRHVKYEDVIDVSTIMVHFENITHSKFLPSNTQRCIRQALHEH